MSVTSAMYTGVSGLINSGEAMNVLGNNIANVNTTGFKESRTLFSDLLSRNTGKSSQVGTGVQLQSVQNLFTQGTAQASDNVTDLTIQGNSFFALQSPTSPVATQNTAYLSRNGAFSVNKDLTLVNADGYQVLDTAGKPIVFVNSGTSPTTDFAKITKIDPNGVITYLATDGVTQNYYNASNGTSGPDLADSANAAANASSTSAAVYKASAANAQTSAAEASSLATLASGSSDTVTITNASNALTASKAAAVAADTAAKSALADAKAAYNAAAAAASVTVDPLVQATLTAAKAVYDGSTGSPTGTAVTAAAAAATALSDATTAAAITDVTTASAAASTASTSATAADSASVLASASAATFATAANTAAAVTGTTGSRSVSAANANTVQRIALVTITDPNALTKVGGSLYASNANSGVSIAGFSLASNSPNGTSEAIQSNTLEGSNVDIASEFVKMIVTQRAYQANSKTISTADQMTQDVLGLIR